MCSTSLFKEEDFRKNRKSSFSYSLNSIFFFSCIQFEQREKSRTCGRMENFMEKVSSSVRFAGHNERSFLSAMIGGLISFLIFSLSFLVILSLIAYKNADPTKLIQPFSYTALCASSFVFGFTSGKLRRKQGALIGFSAGLLQTFIIFSVSAALSAKTNTPIGMAICLYLAVIALATVGGLFGMQKKSRKKRRRR